MCPVLRVCRIATAWEVISALDEAVRQFGKPKIIRVDQGCQFTSRELDLWAYSYGVTLDFSRPTRMLSNSPSFGSGRLFHRFGPDPGAPPFGEVLISRLRSFNAGSLFRAFAWNVVVVGAAAITDPRSQRIRASRRGGQITTSNSRFMSVRRPARTCVLPVPRGPDHPSLIN
ncbi:DDE-type integrase/transposase/recombinase [Microvirga sp. P5_D2]